MMLKNKQETQNEEEKENETPLNNESNIKKIPGTPSRKIETNSIQLKSIEKQLVFKYRTRQSDKFDETPKRPLNEPLTKIHSINNNFNGEEDEEDDFLKLETVKPISWRNSVVNSNEMIIDITNGMSINLNLINNTPKTPHNNRKSLFSHQPGSTDISQSPLLKLAYISSHGKRLSRSGQI
jgi:hypothetical protein